MTVKKHLSNEARLQILEDYLGSDPLHNALAERMNNTIKNSWYVSSEEFTFQEVCERIKQAVYMYNTARPHSAIAFKIPLQCIENKVINSLMIV